MRAPLGKTGDARRGIIGPAQSLSNAEKDWQGLNLKSAPENQGANGKNGKKAYTHPHDRVLEEHPKPSDGQEGDCDDLYQRPVTFQEPLVAYTIPSFIRPASLIMFWFQGGSQTSWTSASSMPSIVRILLWASCAIAGPMPQPGAVRVIFTSTFTPPSGRFVSWQS